MAPKQKTKKKNFNDNEREVLLSEVEARKNVLFKSVSTITGTGKKEAWDAVTQAVNVVSPEIRTVAEVKKKWFDMKFEAKRRISVQQRKKDTGGGQCCFRQRKLWLNIVVNEPLSRDENETRRNVNAGHVTITIIKCIMQYRWRIKTRLNVVYIVFIKTMLKCLFIFIDQNETKQCYNVILSRFVAFPVSHFRGCQGCQVFATTPPPPPIFYSKLAQSHFEGGSPVKFAFQGLNITLLGSLQTADMKNNPRQQC